MWWGRTGKAEVPLIMSWPGVIPSGQRCDRVISALDVNATILDALDAPALPNSAGRSMLGLVDGRGNAEVWDDTAFSEYCSDEFCPSGGCYQRMVRQGEWKLIYYHGQPPQLFNLQDDPDEKINRADDDTCQEILRALTDQVLDGWDPEWIRARMAAKKADVALLREWAKHVQPPDAYRWPMQPEMNYLE